MLSLLPLLSLDEAITLQDEPDKSGIAVCEVQAPDDFRPYILCVAETDFGLADRALNRRWAVTLTTI